MLIFAAVRKEDSSESNPILLGSEKLSCFIFIAFVMSFPSFRGYTFAHTGAWRTDLFFDFYLSSPAWSTKASFLPRFVWMGIAFALSSG
jgi:hypothetical protein